jgi:excisionase family DNA binding protein
MSERNKRPPMTVKEAALYLGRPARAVRDFCKRGLIKYSKSSPKKWMLDRDDVETFLERTC